MAWFEIFFGQRAPNSLFRWPKRQIWKAKTGGSIYAKIDEKWYTFRGGAPIYFLLNGLILIELHLINLGEVEIVPVYL